MKSVLKKGREAITWDAFINLTLGTIVGLLSAFLIAIFTPDEYIYIQVIGTIFGIAVVIAIFSYENKKDALVFGFFLLLVCIRGCFRFMPNEEAWEKCLLFANYFSIFFSLSYICGHYHRKWLTTDSRTGEPINFPPNPPAKK